MTRNVDKELELTIYRAFSDSHARSFLTFLTDYSEEYVLSFDVVGSDGDCEIDCINIIHGNQVEGILESEFDDPDDPMLAWPDSTLRLRPLHFKSETFSRDEMATSKYLSPMLDYDFPIKHTYDKDSDLYQKIIMICKMILI